MALEIVDLPMKNGGFFHSYVGLPKGDGVENDGNIMKYPPYRGFHKWCYPRIDGFL